MIANVHCSYVVQQISWQSERQSSLDLARPSGPLVLSHFPLQSDIDLRKLGSLFVPLVSLLSFSFSPGTFGAFPVRYLVDLSLLSAAWTGRGHHVFTIPKPNKPANLLNAALLPLQLLSLFRNIVMEGLFIILMLFICNEQDGLIEINAHDSMKMAQHNLFDLVAPALIRCFVIFI